MMSLNLSRMDILLPPEIPSSLYIVYVLLLKPKRNYHLSVFAFMVLKLQTDQSENEQIYSTNIIHHSSDGMQIYGVHLEKTGYGISYLIKCLTQVFLPTATRFCHFRYWKVDGEGTQLSEVSRINGIVHETVELYNVTGSSEFTTFGEWDQSE